MKTNTNVNKYKCKIY